MFVTVHITGRSLQKRPAIFRRSLIDRCPSTTNSEVPGCLLGDGPGSFRAATARHVNNPKPLLPRVFASRSVRCLLGFEVGRKPELLPISTARRKGMPTWLLPLPCGKVVHERCGGSCGYLRGIEQNPRRYWPRTGMLVQRAADWSALGPSAR